MHTAEDAYWALRYGEDPQFMDVREMEETNIERSVGFHFVPLSALKQEGAKALDDCLNKEAPLYVHSSSEDTGEPAMEAAELLEAMGFQDVRVLQGGLRMLKAQGFMTEHGGKYRFIDS